jgi:hypothetical protein
MQVVLQLLHIMHMKTNTPTVVGNNSISLLTHARQHALKRMRKE